MKGNGRITDMDCYYSFEFHFIPKHKNEGLIPYDPTGIYEKKSPFKHIRHFLFVRFVFVAIVVS